MSNVPRARKMLTETLRSDDLGFVHGGVRNALELLYRKQPKFKADAEYHKLSPSQRLEALRMRQTGIGINTIARELGTNHGRVSEALTEELGKKEETS